MKFSLLVGVMVLISIVLACNQSKENPMGETPVMPNVDSNTKQLEANKTLVLEFYQQMFGDKDVTAVDRYIGTSYLQHNPTVADGPEVFKETAKKSFEGQPKTKIDVQHMAAENDLVIIHLKNKKSDGTLTSTIDIFRIADGKIVEHWDAHQDVPKVSANAHPMF